MQERRDDRRNRQSSRHVYGPVPSRRLGRSLGISVIPPKTCTHSCVYCQLGRTTRLTDEPKSFFSPDAILDEITEQMRISEVDYITFAGDGEPTLSSDLGWLIRKCRERFETPVAVITNSSLMSRSDVRKELLAANVVLPSLDAGSDELFRRIDRPHGRLDFQAIVDGLIEFRREYAGEIWLEVMLVAGLNDTESALQDIRRLARRIAPERVYVVTPTRPPAESWVRPPNPDRILRAQQILGPTETLSHRETGDFDREAWTDAREALIQIGSRHPLRKEQALEIAQEFAESSVVSDMLETGQLLSVNYLSTEYLLPAHFVRRN